MMWCETYVLAFVVVYVSVSTAIPLQTQQNGVSTGDSEQIVMGDALVRTNNLHISSKPEAEDENSNDKEIQQNNKNDTSASQTDDNDDLFLPEKFPDLPNDEYLDIDEDATPFDFLKKSAKPKKGRIQTQPLSPTNNTTNAIYITVPIFVNAANEGAPLSLSVGGQTMPLNSKSPPLKVETTKNFTPTSEFNKLAYRPHPKRVSALPQHSQNRHRSFVQGRSREQKYGIPIRELNEYDTYLIYY